MKLYRKGFICLPNEYVDYHKSLAQESKLDLLKKGYIIYAEFIKSDEYGMPRTHLILRTPNNHLREYYWYDANSRGSWFEVSQGGFGSTRVY